MIEPLYGSGTIKLTWINPNNYSILESKMFPKENLQQALEESKGKNKWMIFELKSTSGDQYSWSLLPYGEAKSFVRTMQFRDSIWYPLLIGAGILSVVYLGINYKK
jgi:hypothetical protein